MAGKQYFSTSPVRDNATNNRLTQQVPNPFAGLQPGTGLNVATVPRSQLLRPYPQFTSIQATETIGTSDYHAMQARVERRMAQGFTVQLAYSGNALNRVNLHDPNTTTTSTALGTITAQNGLPRQLQIAVRVSS